MLGAHALQHGEEQISQRRRAGADVDAAEPAVLVAAERGYRPALGFEDAVGMVDQLAPGGRRIGALAHAVDEPGCHLALELADLQADRRLSEVQAPRRRRKAAE